MLAGTLEYHNVFKGRNFTNNEIRQVEHISPDGKTECARYWVARWLEQNAVRVDALRAVLKSMGSEILPVFNYRLVFK
jgi:hypothetical protein